MSISIFPMTQTFAAEIGDVDLVNISTEDLAAVRAAFSRYAVLVFPVQQLSVQQHVNFAAHFGPLERTVSATFRDNKLRVREEAVSDIANLEADGRIWNETSRVRQFQLGNRIWHTDSSFKAPSGYASLLYARAVAPIGGHTQFADMRAAYDALPEAMKTRLEGLKGEHSLLFSRARLGFQNFTEDERIAFSPVVRPLVRTIPENDRRSLYVASHIGKIRGMSDSDALKLVDELIAHATQAQFVYTHRWRVGDLVMWDNRCTMHRGTDFEDTRWVRDLQRVTTSDRSDAFGIVEVPRPGVAASY
jgi:alpha-ketoglutarate-dependent 2,4-dichlorophenoxyacetate dioxygenase